MDLLPATIDLASADHDFAAADGRERMLEHVLDPLREKYHYIVIDCSPSLGLMTINALIAADQVLVPLKCETLAHRGLGQLMEAIEEVQRWANPDLRVVGLVPTLYDGRTMHARAILADLGPRFGYPCSMRFREASASPKPLPWAGRSWRPAPRSEGAAAYRRVAQALDS